MPAGRSSARQAGPQGSRSRRWNPGRCSPATRRVGVHVRKKRIPFPGETRIKKGEKGKAGTGSVVDSSFAGKKIYYVPALCKACAKYWECRDEKLKERNKQATGGSVKISDLP
ncbi:uncharacterized protein isoform X3 [Castor canadensis]|uniref:Uncharacterized protein isoform X3 n=1 Tax=Castor canadensis TaxID=51338 RepID=A0AC58NE18_CASCN